jgi:serine/threonine protein phosphatase PrpC
LINSDAELTETINDRRQAPAQSIPLGPVSGRPRLALRLGHSTRAVEQKHNEDFYGIVTPDVEPDAGTRGIALAVADGASGVGAGRVASETAVRSLLHDYYSTSPAWPVSQAVDCVLRSINDWLLVENMRQPEADGVVTTMSMLLFRGDYYYLAHVGDTRVYRKRGAVLKQLTVDHTWPRRDMRHVLKRAVGLDTHLVVDFADGELQQGEVFLMVSDGVWEVLGDRAMHEALGGLDDPQAVAEALTERSISSQARYMGRNDATAVVAAVGLSESP